VDHVIMLLAFLDVLLALLLALGRRL